jgi:competence protein ComEA
MPSGLSRTELATYAACAVLVVLLGLRVLHSEGDGSASASPVAKTTTAGSAVSVSAPRAAAALVHVVGAVRRAGVYRVAAGKRIQDAIRLAGGATTHADLQAINLAAKVSDGQQVIVPRRGATAATATPSAPGAAGSAPPVNLNTATAEQLDTLDGVGPTTAQKILTFRQQHGGFSSVDDLTQIPGIGPKKLAALKPQVTV